MKFRKYSLVATAVVLLLTGCASNLDGETYSRSDARQAQHVQVGTVVSTRPVKIQGTESGAGAVTGAVVGGFAGNAIGGGRGRRLATAAGIIGGAFAGSAIEESATKSQGVEILVKLDDTKKTRAYVQTATGAKFYSGQRVRVTTMANGTARVNPM